MTAAESDRGDDASSIAATRDRSAERQAKLRRGRRATLAAIAAAIAVQFVLLSHRQAERQSAPLRAAAAAFQREWTPRAYVWTADRATPAQDAARVQPDAITADLALYSARWLSGPQWPLGVGDEMDFDRRQASAWREAPLRARTVRIQALGDHPLAGLLAEQLFRALCDDCDLATVRLFPPGGEPNGEDAPDIDLFVGVDRAVVTHAKGRTKVDIEVRFEACGGAPDLPAMGGSTTAERAWSRAVRRRMARWVHAEAGAHDGVPLWRLVATGVVDPVALFHDTRQLLTELGVRQATSLHATPSAPSVAQLPYEPTPALPWPDGAVTQQVSSRCGVGCANDTRWTIAPAGPADAWLAALRQRFVAAGWQQDVESVAGGRVALRRGDESFVCESVPAVFARRAVADGPQWLPAAPGASSPLRATYRKGLPSEALRARLATAPAPSKAQLAWAAHSFELVPPSWQQAVRAAPLADYASAVPWPALVAVAKAQAAAGDLQAARTTMGAAFVQAQLVTAFEPLQESAPAAPARSALERFEAAWSELAPALGLPATPPAAASPADVAAVGGVVVSAEAIDGTEVGSCNGFLWLAARADRPGFTAFWFSGVSFRPDGPAPMDARTSFVAARRRASGLAAPTLLREPRLELMRADFAGRAARFARDGDPRAAPPIGLRATVVDDARLRVRAAK